MRHQSMRWIAILILAMAARLAGAQQASEAPPYASGEILIKLASGAVKAESGAPSDPSVTGQDSLDRLNQEFRVTTMRKALLPQGDRGGRADEERLAEELSRIYLLRYEDDRDVLDVVQAYQEHPAVIYAQPNYLNRLCIVPDDSLYTQQWALSTMRMPAAWDIERGSEEIVVGVVDSGIDYRHEDLAGNVWINAGEDLNGDGRVDSTDFNGLDDDGNGYVDDIRGWDFTDAPQFAGIGDYVGRDNDPDDDLGHGTHVSGIVAALSDNGKGVAGLCWHAKIMPLRASFRISAGAFLEDDDVAAGIVYAADNGARVINMSWGDPRISPMIRDVVAYASARGCVLVAAAGNVDQEGLFYPGGYDQTIAVGASTSYDQRATFSSFGKNLDVLAPGSNILSTLPNDQYGSLGGTSMATAHVSGLAALILSKNPNMDAEEVRGIITSSARDLESPGWDPETGSGRIDGLVALQMDRATRVQIHSPQTGSGLDQRAVIMGTALGLLVEEYSLGFGLGLSPAQYQAIVGPLRRQVWAETLAVWEGVAQLPDTSCAIRLQVKQVDGRVVEDRVVVHVDHTPPVLSDVGIIRRLDGEGYASFVECRSDDESLLEVYYRREGQEEFTSLSGIHWSREHSLDLSSEMEPGDYQLYLAATNAAGLRTVEDNAGQYFGLSAPFQQVEQGGFLLLDQLPLGYLFHRPTDLDQDGRREILFMDFSDTSTYGPAMAYEMDDAGRLEKAFQSQAHYLVWDTGDTDGDGQMEILGGGYAEIYLFESAGAGDFPDPLNPVWSEQGVWGSQFADVDGDGWMEIVSKVEVGSDVIIFENVGNDSLARVASLANPTGGRNSTGTRFGIADFDGDGKGEILAGDDDGEIYIYEFSGQDNQYVHTWSDSTGLGDARYLAVGDSLESGGVWFAVAASQTDVYDPRSAYWRVMVYYPVADNQFTPIWQEEIVGVSGQGNGLLAADFDGDGDKEVAFCAVPDLYVLGPAEDRSFEPIWYTPCGFMYRPMIGDLDGDGFVEIAFNGPDSMVVLEPAEAGQAPPPPSGLVAQPLDQDRIFLEWMEAPGAVGYNLHRGLEYFELDRIETGLLNTTYLDTGLIANQTYYYAVTSVDSAGQESRFYSIVVWATPNPPPHIMAVETLAPGHLAVLFDEPMGASAQVASHYAIEKGIGSPSSVILDQQKKRALLSLRTSLRPETVYTIRATHMADATGVPIAADGDSISFRTPADTAWQFLYLHRIELLDRASLDVFFSEAVDSSSAVDIDHYLLEPSGTVQAAWLDSSRGDLVHLKLSSLHAAGFIYTLAVKDIWNQVMDRTLFPGRGDALSFSLPATDLTAAAVVPQPFLPERDGRLQFVNLPAKTSVSVFTLFGELVWEGRTSEGGTIFWSGDNSSGQALASGVYLFLLNSGGEYQRDKLVLIR